MAITPANAGSSEGQAARDSAGPRAVPGHRAAVPSAAEPQDAQPGTAQAAESAALAWVPYLIVLAGVAAGVYLVFQGSKYAAQGTGLLGCSLLAGALARLLLPPRLAGLLSSRRKTSDVLAFTAFGAGVLVVALLLP